MFRIVFATLLLMSGSIAFAAECAPERMVRIVTQDATPGIDPTSFAVQPKTLYRTGRDRGRVEEAPDPVNRIHGLVVVSEPDVWIVNLYDRSGQHVVDPGPSLVFHAPVLRGTDLPAPFRELEFGCEQAFIQAYAPKPDGRVDVGNNLVLNRHQVTRGEHRVLFLVHPKDGQLFAVAQYRADKLEGVLRYLEYQVALAPNPKLFERPQGINFTPGRPKAGP